MTQRILLHMTAPLREDFDIPYHDIGEAHAPPRVALVAGLHGNELNGVFVLSRLAAFLQGVTEGQHPGLRLRHRAIILPAVNILGLNTWNRHWPFDNTDINRMFPGYDAGETTQRIAHAVLEVTRPAHYRSTFTVPTSISKSSPRYASMIRPRMNGLRLVCSACRR